MKQRLLKILSITSLSLSIALAPLLACACLEEIQPEAHACCPDASESTPEGDPNKLGGKECCAFQGYPGKKNLQISKLEEAPTGLTLGLLTEPVSIFKTQVLQPYQNLACDGDGDQNPPQAYLKHHSLLL